MGKYDAVLEGLPPAPIEDLGYQDKVNEAKHEFTVDPATGEFLTPTPEQLAIWYVEQRQRHAEIDAQRAAVQLKLTALEQLLVDSWDADQEGWGAYGAGDNTVRVRSGAAVDVVPQPEGKIVDKELFRRWCATPIEICMVCGQTEFTPHEEMDHSFTSGGGLAASLQLWPSTMNAIVKQRTHAGQPPPPGTIAQRRVIVKLRKA